MAVKQITLTGQRIVLRPWHDDDADAFAAMNSDSRVMEFFVSPLSRSESDQLLSRMRAVIEEQGWGW
jgi:RimJ/RimL family protein N-acetyltransferase